MPEQEPNPIEESAGESVPEKPSRLAKIKIFAFVGIVVVVECLVAYLYLPSAADTAAMAEATIGQKAEEGEFDQKELSEEELANQVEVDLEEFSVTVAQPITSTALRIDFHLWGTVADDDYDEFNLLMEGKLHRFRNEVITTVRSADITDLTDPQLGLIKRKILERTNRTLGKPLLRAVIFSDFSFIEQ